MRNGPGASTTKGPDARSSWESFKIIRVRLNEPWYACLSAKATILLANGPVNQDLGFHDGPNITVCDPLGTIHNELAAMQASSSGSGVGSAYIPAGTCCLVKYFADDNAWEPIGVYGTCGCPGSSSSSWCRAVRRVPAPVRRAARQARGPEVPAARDPLEAQDRRDRAVASGSWSGTSGTCPPGTCSVPCPPTDGENCYLTANGSAMAWNCT